MGGCTSTNIRLPNEKRYRRAIKLYQVSEVRNLTNILNRNRCFETGESPLTLAAQQGHEAVVEALIWAGADVNMLDVNGRTPIHVAVQLNDSETLEILLHHKANPNLHDGDHITPLQIAAQRGYADIAETLLDAGAAPNGSEGDTPPLISAVSNGYYDAVKVLLEAGAHPNVDRDGETAISLAVNNGDVNIAKLLFNHDVTVSRDAARKLLAFAAMTGKRELVEMFLELASNGLEVKDDDDEMPPAVIAATASESTECLDALLVNGRTRDVNLTDRRGQTALQIAVHSVIDTDRRTYYERYFSNVYRHYAKRDPVQVSADKCIKCIMSLVQAGADVSAVWNRFVDIFPSSPNGITFEQMVVCEVLVQAYGFKELPLVKVRRLIQHLMTLREFGLVKLIYSAGVDPSWQDLNPLSLMAGTPLDTDMFRYVQLLCSNPRRLDDLSRQTLRRLLSWNTLYLVSQLSLPDEVKDFVCIVDTVYYTDTKLE